MSRSVIFTPEAQDDLFDLYDYIRDRSDSTRAIHYVERIERACMSLEMLPERGTRRDDLRPGLRVMGFERRVAIAFQVGPDSVAILRILYGGRSLEAIFEQDEI